MVSMFEALPFIIGEINTGNTIIIMYERDNSTEDLFFFNHCRNVKDSFSSSYFFYDDIWSELLSVWRPAYELYFLL